MQKRLWLLVAAALIIVVLLLYPSTQCRVSATDLTASTPKGFVVPVEQGYVAAFSFNVTNGGGCEITARSIEVMVRGVVYVGGNQTAISSEETENVGGTIVPGETATFSYTLNSYFDFRPSKLLLRIEMTFMEAGPVLVFDGELIL